MALTILGCLATFLSASVAQANIIEIHAGDSFPDHLRALVAGDELVVHAGTYSTCCREQLIKSGS